MAMIIRTFRQSQKEIDATARAMKLSGIENESEYIRDAIRRRNEQLERADKKKGAQTR